MSRDFVSFGICSDEADADRAFEGFQFLEYDQTSPTELNLGCTQSQMYTLSGERLIGFNVETGESSTDGESFRSIRSIQPIVDCVDCTDSQVSLNSLTSMEQAVGGGELRQQLISDTISSSYFESDGFSAC